MFAFSQIQPETRGQVADMEVPMSKYLRTSVSQGLHDSIYAQWWRLNERWAEERDTDYAMLSPEDVKKNYGIDTKEPMRENIAMALQTQKQAQAERDFILQNDNHSFVAGAMGMTATMVASMLNPVDLALMFVPIVGQETKLAAGASALGRGRAALRTGLVTRETLQFIVPKAPKLAESVIQGAAYMVAYEAINQPLGRLEHRDPGDPFLNIAAGTGIAAGFHGVVTALSKLLFRMPAEVQQAAVLKAADDVAKGKDIDVTDIIKSTEAFAKEQVAAKDVDIALPSTKVDFQAFEEKVRTIFRNSLNKLRQEVLPGKAPKPTVPGTPAEYERNAFTSVLDEIRQRGLRTKEQIQTAFPEAQLSREEAAVLRREAWGEQEVKKQRADNLEQIIEKVRNQTQPEKQMSLKRKARMDAERNMPNPFKDEAELESHITNDSEKRTTKITEETAELEKKLAKQKPEGPPVVTEPVPKKVKAPTPQKVATDSAIRDLHKGWEADELTPRDIATSLVDELKGKRGYGELRDAAKKYLKELEDDAKMWGHRGNEDTAAEEAFMDLLEQHMAKITPEEKLPPAEIGKALGLRYDGVQTWMGQSPVDVYTLPDKKNPFTIYVPEGSPREVVEDAIKKKIAENTPMPKAIETAVDCVAKQLPLV